MFPLIKRLPFLFVLCTTWLCEFKVWQASLGSSLFAKVQKAVPSQSSGQTRVISHLHSTKSLTQHFYSFPYGVLRGGKYIKYNRVLILVILYPIYQKHFNAIMTPFIGNKFNEKMQVCANQFTKRGFPVCQQGAETPSELFSFPTTALR